MPYDRDLEQRIRSELASEPALSERRMFGGLAFLIGGNMAVAASAQGIMVRVDPAQSDELLATTTATRMEMGGRPMRGWLRLGAEAVREPDELARWMSHGTRYARSLPAKR